MADGTQEYTLKVLAAVRSVSDQLRAMRTTRLPFKEASAAQQVAAGAMLRVPGLATAVVLLIENKLVLECEPIIRSLLETAINVAWIGTDNARAQSFKADSARQVRLWLSEVEKNQPIPESAKSQAEALVTRWEACGSARLDRSLEARAREASVDSVHVRIATLEELYAKYRRLSGVAHGDLRADSLVLEDTSALASLDAQDTAAALIVCVAAAAHSLGIEVEVKSVLGELRRALERP